MRALCVDFCAVVVGTFMNALLLVKLRVFGHSPPLDRGGDDGGCSSTS